MKAVLFVPLLALGCIFAGIYGAVHNQISFTVSPEYFYDFKFKQFAIPSHEQGRLGAAIVGWHASWWMGLIIGLPVLSVALILPGPRNYFIQSLLAFGIVMVTALLVGLGALVFSFFDVTADSLPWLNYPEGVDNRVAFVRAGTMHNFSYLGGLLGIITAIIYLLVVRYRLQPKKNGGPEPAE